MHCGSTIVSYVTMVMNVYHINIQRYLHHGSSLNVLYALGYSYCKWSKLEQDRKRVNRRVAQLSIRLLSQTFTSFRPGTEWRKSSRESTCSFNSGHLMEKIYQCIRVSLDSLLATELLYILITLYEAYLLKIIMTMFL